MNNLPLNKYIVNIIGSYNLPNKTIYLFNELIANTFFIRYCLDNNKLSCGFEIFQDCYNFSNKKIKRFYSWDIC